VAAEHATQPFHVYLDRWLETAQKVAVGAAEQACGPREARVPRRLAGAVEDLDHEPVRVAPDEAGPASIARQQLDRLDGHRAGSHVPTEHDQVNPRLLDLRQDRLQGGQVAMDVAKHRDAHPTIMPFGRPNNVGASPARLASSPPSSTLHSDISGFDPSSLIRVSKRKAERPQISVGFYPKPLGVVPPAGIAHADSADYIAAVPVITPRR